MSPRKRCWSFSAGEYPNTVRVFEREPGGALYAQAWDPSVGYSRRISLRHRDQDLAIAYAEGEARKLRDGADALVASPTIGFVTMQYLIHRTPAKVSAPSPLPGQHTREALRLAGYEDAAIERLLADGVAVETLLPRG